MSEVDENNIGDGGEVPKEGDDAPSLDKIYDEFNIKAQDDDGEPPASSSPPDTSGVDSSEGTDISALSQKVDSLMNKLSANEAKSEQEALQRDINTAVKTVNEVAKLPKASFVEGELAQLYKNDPKFKAAFDNRDSNPGAYKAVLKGVGETLFREAQVSPAPQTDADRSNFEQGINNSATRPGQTAEQTELDEKLEGMSGTAHDNYMRNLSRQV